MVAIQSSFRSFPVYRNSRRFATTFMKKVPRVKLARRGDASTGEFDVRDHPERCTLAQARLQYSMRRLAVFLCVLAACICQAQVTIRMMAGPAQGIPAKEATDSR